jgi:hypothetical protein
VTAKILDSSTCSKLLLVFIVPPVVSLTVISKNVSLPAALI